MFNLHVLLIIVVLINSDLGFETVPLRSIPNYFNIIIYYGSNSTYINKTGNLVVGLVLQKHNLKEKIGSTFSAEISHD